MPPTILRLMLLGCLLSLIAACAPGLEATASATTPRATGEAPRPTPATVTAEPSATTPPPPTYGSTLTWVAIGEIPGIADVFGWWFSEGYLALGAVEVDGDLAPVVWFSPNGTEWHRTDLSTPFKPCPGWVVRPSATVSHGWAAGGGAVVIGTEYVPDANTCGEERVVTWSTGDGRTWTKSAAFGPDGLVGRYPVGIWATPEGWEAAIQEPDETVSIWQSPGADDWHQVARIDGSVRIAVANDGTRLAIEGDVGERARMFVSTDGIEWRPIEGPPRPDMRDNESWRLGHVLPPDGSLQAWIVVSELETGDIRSTMWMSSDLELWEPADFPMPVVGGLGYTSDGIVALGMDPCRDTGGPCLTDPPQYFISGDGYNGEPMRSVVGPSSFAEGPGCVIGTGDSGAEGAATVYRLEHYTDEEASLFHGLRDDARQSCAPIRKGLPAGAIAAVECAPSSGVVDRVGAYRFEDEGVMLDSYWDRLAEEGVEAGSGSCPRSPGDAPYPTEDGSTGHRAGCFINRFDNANYRLTFPDSLTYVGVLGTGDNLTKVRDWIWKGSDPATEAPSVWRDPGG